MTFLRRALKGDCRPGWENTLPAGVPEFWGRLPRDHMEKNGDDESFLPCSWVISVWAERRKVR